MTWSNISPFVMRHGMLLEDLDPQQRAAGRFRANDGHIQGGAGRDNAQLAYEGIHFDELDANQQQTLLRLIELYTGRLRRGHDRVKMDEVLRYMRQTDFVWYGGIGSSR